MLRLCSELQYSSFSKSTGRLAYFLQHFSLYSFRNSTSAIVKLTTYVDNLKSWNAERYLEPLFGVVEMLTGVALKPKNSAGSPFKGLFDELLGAGPPKPIPSRGNVYRSGKTQQQTMKSLLVDVIDCFTDLGNA